MCTSLTRIIDNDPLYTINNNNNKADVNNIIYFAWNNISNNTAELVNMWYDLAIVIDKFHCLRQLIDK